MRAFPEKASFNAFHSLMRPRNQPTETALSLTHTPTLCASLRQSTPVRSRALEGSRMDDAARSRQPSSSFIRRPSTLPVCRRLETIVKRKPWQNGVAHRAYSRRPAYRGRSPRTGRVSITHNHLNWGRVRVAIVFERPPKALGECLKVVGGAWVVVVVVLP